MGDLKILKGGILTTVQDGGRVGYQKYGVPVSGVMDFYAYRIGNMLVGNSGSEAVLEVTLPGFSMEFLTESRIAVTGGDLCPKLSGRPLLMWESKIVVPGDKLVFTGLKSGCRSYIALAGGIETPKVMNSRSTYVRGKLGGYKGRALQEGDLLNLGSPETSINKVQERSFASRALEYYETITIRTVPGPQEEAFTNEGIEQFYQSVYKVSNDSDRMGYRLEGPIVEHRDKPEIISDGIAMGALQIPGHGRPIVMMADRQTAGGYPKIGNVITADLPKIAQAKPGDQIRFQKVTMKEAQKAYRAMQTELEEMQRTLIKPIEEPQRDQQKFIVRVNGREYTVVVERRDTR